MPLPAGGGCAGRCPDEPGDGVMTVPEYSMRSGEIFLKREEKAGKFLLKSFPVFFPWWRQPDGGGRFFLRWKVFSGSIIAHHHEWFSTSPMWLERGGISGRFRSGGDSCRISVPQQSKFTSQTVAFSGKPSVTIRSAKAGGSKLLDGVPEKSGAYKLVISPQGKVGIGAHDERGHFTPCRRCGSWERRPAEKA